ncbi:MAG: hypothetical protein JO340_19990 [Acidobacteriaceae bacterium]|nr:hypothetical protein [Acidobacteriaceae bacterium]
MNIESKVSGHWTDEQLVGHLYGVGPGDGHLDACASCLARLSAMRSRREAVEKNSALAEDGDFEFLASQRRRIYRRISQPAPWWQVAQLKRWASAAAGLLVFAGGLLFIESHHHPQPPAPAISDAQLAQDVGRMAEDSEPPPTAPLQALFEE